tara:strand:- start:3107 stop:3484 length:378 start_codon:yes stop_codon:yes gene_type:complete
MALSSAQFDSTVLTYKIIKQTITNATANVDVTSESGRLYEISLVNSSSSNAYFKATLSDDVVTPGTTIPELMIRVDSGESKRWHIPDGLAFTKLSFWAVTNPTDNNTTSPTLNSGNGLVTTLVTS